MSDFGKNPRRVSALFELITLNHGKTAANGSMRFLRAIYNREAEFNNDLPRNPVRRGIIRWHKTVPNKPYLKDEQLEAWGEEVRTIQNPLRRGLQLLLLLSRQRSKATRKVRWEHVDLTDKTLFVPEPKGGKIRAFTLPLSDAMVTILNHLRRLREAPAWPYTEERHQPWVFPSNSEEGYISEVKEQRRSGVPGPHALRRTFASCAYGAKVPESDVKYLMNHSFGSHMTAQYARAYVEPLRTTQQRITDFIFSNLKCSVEEVLGPIPTRSWSNRDNRE